MQTAIESLTCMTHRGGIAADGRTGDGCGLLLQMPRPFMRTLAKACFDRELSDNFAVGQVFLSTEPARAAKARDAMEAALVEQGLQVVGWRTVPTHSGAYFGHGFHEDGLASAVDVVEAMNRTDVLGVAAE